MASPLQLAYVGMQCFLNAESSFACMAGVLKTRVGYVGGTAESSNYAQIGGGNTEVTELQFDPLKCTYDDVLDWFFDHHDPTQQQPKEYQSAIFWVDDAQRQKAEMALQKANTKFGGRGGVQTCVKKMDTFFPALEFHQKYWLRTQSAVFNELNLSDHELVDSSLAAKLNAFLGGGFTDFRVLRQLQTEHGLSDEVTNIVEQIAELMKMKKSFAQARETEFWRHFAKMSKYDESVKGFVQAMENFTLPTIAAQTAQPMKIPPPPKGPAPRPPPQSSSSSAPTSSRSSPLYLTIASPPYDPVASPLYDPVARPLPCPSSGSNDIGNEPPPKPNRRASC